MKILKGNKGNVDFEHSLQLDALQKERLLNFLRDMFYYVEEKEVKEFRDERIGQKKFSREWEDEEFEVLFRPDEDNETVGRKLGRSWMSIEMKRVVSDYPAIVMNYAEKKNINVYEVDIKEMVKEFVRDHKEKLESKKKIRSERNKRLKNLRSERDSLTEMIPKHETIGIQLGHITKEELQKKKDRLIDVNKQIEELESGPITISRQESLEDEEDEETTSKNSD